MFQRIREQKIINKNNESKSRSKSNNLKTRDKSYSKIQRKKQNGSDLYDYEIAWICDHLYQGCFKDNKKHGQGLMILTNGIVVIGNWINGFLNGYALFLSPFGAKIHTNYKSGFLHGWAIMEYRDSFEIFQFHKDICNSIRRRHDQSEQVWTEAAFSKDGKLQKILTIQKTSDCELPSFIQDQSLISFYTQVILRNEIKIKSNRLKVIKINDKFQYFGYTDQYQTPHGLGIIYSNDEIYSGNFKSGSLDIYGMIVFQNGIIYKGEIYSGKIWGNGLIYDIHLDETKTVKVSQEGVELVLSQEPGFKLDQIAYNFGKIPQMPLQKGFSQNISVILDQITKYYYRFHSVMQQQYSITQSSIDQYSANSSSNHQKIIQQQFESKNHDEKSLNQSKESIKLSIVENTKNTKTPKFQKMMERKKGSLQYSNPSFQEITPITSGQKIPSQTPSYEQISKQTKGMKREPKYPYLMQFQLNKNILSPYKLAKVGKIVANSLNMFESYR